MGGSGRRGGRGGREWGPLEPKSAGAFGEVGGGGTLSRETDRPPAGECIARMGPPYRSRRSLKAARGAREPWWLAGSPRLSVLDAAAIMAIYAKRMRIEPSFRDLKNERLGLGFSSARAHSAKQT
jgi:hypothetical protein